MRTNALLVTLRRAWNSRSTRKRNSRDNARETRRGIPYDARSVNRRKDQRRAERGELQISHRGESLAGLSKRSSLGIRLLCKQVEVFRVLPRAVIRQHRFIYETILAPRRPSSCFNSHGHGRDVTARRTWFVTYVSRFCPACFSASRYADSAESAICRNATGVDEIFGSIRDGDRSLDLTRGSRTLAVSRHGVWSWPRVTRVFRACLPSWRVARNDRRRVACLFRLHPTSRV